MKLLLFMFFVAFLTPLYFRIAATGFCSIDAPLLKEAGILALGITCVYWLLCQGGDHHDHG